VKKVNPDLRRIAARLAEVLGPDRCLVVGTLAVAVHGYPHATDHVELLTSLDLQEVRKLLRADGIDTLPQRRNGLAEGWPSVHGTLAGTRFEVLPELVPLQWDHAMSLSMGSAILRIIDLDGLLRLKRRPHGGGVGELFPGRVRRSEERVGRPCP